MILAFPVLVLYVYPEPKNHCLNSPKMIREVSSVTSAGKLLASCFCAFEQQLSA
jgi:hypothetical protein